MTVDVLAPNALTARQKPAVDFRGGNLLVEAVPGSGKTRVIVARCEALLAEGVAAKEILLLTFSRRAVGELRARLARSLEPAKMPEIRTFHGFAARLLSEAGEGGHSRRLLTEPSERALFERTVEMARLPSLQDGIVRSPLFREAASARVAELRRAPPPALAKLANDPLRRHALKISSTSKQNSAGFAPISASPITTISSRARLCSLGKRTVPLQANCAVATGTCSSTNFKIPIRCNSSYCNVSARRCSRSVIRRRPSTAFGAHRETHSTARVKRFR